MLPALPKAWDKGSVKGLRARGGVEVDIAWANSRATECTLRPSMSRETLIKLPRGQSEAQVSESGRPVAVTNENGVMRVNLAAGKLYRVQFA